MEWLRCNKCYRAMKKSKRTFSLTQCGHLYCSQCMAGVNTKCSECGSQNNTTMVLSYPPKLETTHNYFAYLDEFMEICLKTAEFQDNQLSIAVRGFEEIEKKYDNMKKSYWNGMKQIKSLTQACQILQEETTTLEQILESQLKSKEARNVQASKSDSNFSGYFPGEQNNQRIRGYLSTSNEPEKVRASGLPYQYEEQQSTAKFPAANSYATKPMLQTPQQAYNPTSSFSAETFHSDAYASDSGVSSNPETSTSMGVFLVPSGQRVPRSMASLRRKARTYVRLTEPKTELNF